MLLRKIMSSMPGMFTKRCTEELADVITKVNYYVELSKSLVSSSTRGEELTILDIDKEVKQINFKDILKLRAKFTLPSQLGLMPPNQGSKRLPYKITISCNINDEIYDILRLRFKVEWKASKSEI